MQKVDNIINYIYMCTYITTVLLIPIVLLISLLFIFPFPIIWYFITIFYFGGIIFPLIVSSHEVTDTFLRYKITNNLNSRMILILRMRGKEIIKVGLVVGFMLVNLSLGIVFYSNTILQFLFIVLTVVSIIYFLYASVMAHELENNFKKILITTFFMIFYKPKISLFLFLNQIMLFLILQRINFVLLIFPGLGLFVLINVFYYSLLKKYLYTRE
ncbi:hypothetical protein [Enterococcus sp. DIV1314a]|uniref:hypothetical protein n=1 Tax=Enterococcus sp. DIV1314a TaxID=2774660 RepID=UPI003F278DC5